jgi:hypothetical protein
MAKNNFNFSEFNFSDIAFSEPIKAPRLFISKPKPIIDFVTPFINLIVPTYNPAPVFPAPVFTTSLKMQVAKTTLIKGVVKDDLGEVLPDVSLSYVDPKTKLLTGLTTDFYGSFSTKVPANTTINVDYLGFDTQVFNSDNFPTTITLKGGNAAQLPSIELVIPKNKNNTLLYIGGALGLLIVGGILLSGNSKKASKGLKGGVAHVTI